MIPWKEGISDIISAYLCSNYKNDSGSGINLSIIERIYRFLLFQSTHTDKTRYFLVFFFNKRLEDKLQLMARVSAQGCEIRGGAVLFRPSCPPACRMPHPIPRRSAAHEVQIKSKSKSNFWGVAVAAEEERHTSPLDKERSYRLHFLNNQSSSLHPVRKSITGIFLIQILTWANILCSVEEDTGR